MDRRHFLHAAGSLLIGCGRRAPDDNVLLDAGTDATMPVDAAADVDTSDVVETEQIDAAVDAGNARGAQDEEFPAWNGARDSASEATMLMFRGNLRRNFHGTGPVPNEPVLKWKHRMSALEISRAGEGTRFWTGTGWTGQAVKWGRRIFVGGLDGRFYCWDAYSGKVIWMLKTNRMFKSSACFYDGMLFVGNVDNKFRCIDAKSGKVIWQFDMKGDCDSSPVVADGILYAASETGYLHAFDPRSGGRHFKMDLGGHKGPGGSQGIESSPAVDGDELWVANYDGSLYCIDRIQGKVLSKFATGDDTDASPVITDECVFAASEARSPALSCFDRKTGEIRWTFKINGGIWSTPAIVGGRVFIGGDDARMYCLDERTGKLIWSFAAKRAIWSSPSVVDGKVMFGSYDGYFYMVDAETGKGLWQVDLEGPVLSTACVVNGYIWIGSGSGHFYCFGPSA